MDPLSQTLAHLENLIAFATVSSDSNLACIDYIQHHLEKSGARCQRSSDTPGKANLFATLGPECDGGIILSGHSDVVPVTGQNWDTDPFVLHREGSRLFGRGACDMKGFIAACLTLAPHYSINKLRRPVHFAFTYDEEVGCLGARALIRTLKDLGVKPSLCIIGEPTEMRVIEGHKGCGEYTCEFTGVEGHSSLPHRGVNALEYAVEYINALMRLRLALPDRAPAMCRFDPPYSTLSVCGLQAGIAHNVIPNKAKVEWELRYVTETDRAYIRDNIQRFVINSLLPRMKATSSACDIVEVFVSEVAGLEPVEQSEAVRIIRELTGANACDVVSFGTEAGMFQKAGISTVICGPGSIEQAHKPNEFVTTDQLSSCLTVLEKLTGKLTKN